MADLSKLWTVWATWWRCWVGGMDEAADAFNMIVRAYTEPHRHYHTIVSFDQPLEVESNSKGEPK